MSNTNETAFHCLDLTVFRVDQVWMIELTYMNPQDDASKKTERGRVAYDDQKLLALESQHAEYGAALAQQVFAEPKVKAFFLQAESIAQSKNVVLRLRVCIDPSAQELQALRWELLRHPDSNVSLATSEQVLLSRFMLSRDWRPIRLQAKRELRALIAISAPVGPKFSDRGWAVVDSDGERSRVAAALAGIETRTLGSLEAPLTLNALIAALREGVDILYLVAHGTYGKLSGLPLLMLQDESGDVAPANAEDLSQRIAGLGRGPRLVVLASCQSAGDGESPSPQLQTSVHATLAGRLADAGVPAVVAMQGNITMATVEKLMPVLFTELKKDGQIDRALAVARGAVGTRPDHWMPVLYSRLRDGCIWYTPGFRSTDEEGIWKKLLPAMKTGQLLPILGPGLLDTACGDSFEVARELAKESGFPLARHEWDDLPRVSQFLSVRGSRLNLVEQFKGRLIQEIREQHESWLPADALPPKQQNPDLDHLLGLVSDQLRKKRTDVHRLLAELDASIYVTTNYDTLLEHALEARQKTPRSVCSRWRSGSLTPAPPFDPPIDGSSPTDPLIYHVFGAFNNEDTLVITEDDYFDFLIGTIAEKLVPQQVEDAFVNNSLLFLGFRLTDWRFRVLFRLMRNLQGRKQMRRDKYCHVAVQLDPELQSMADVEGAKEYLRQYFHDEARIEIFFGSAEDFLTSLCEAKVREQQRQSQSIQPVQEESDDY